MQNELDINRLSLLSHMTVFPCPLCSKAYYVLFSLIDEVREVDGVKTNFYGGGLLWSSKQCVWVAMESSSLHTREFRNNSKGIHTNDMLKNGLMYM